MASINIFKNDRHFDMFLAGQVIFKEGEPGDLMYVVQEGEVDILVRGKLIETVGPGGVVGEMALIDNDARSATAIAKTDCRLVPLDETRFNLYVHQTPFFALQVMRVMSDRLRHMDAQV
jgi:CRP-like cAMP-binding protein